MALDVWFREDARDALLTVGVAALGAAVANGTPDVHYCRGILDALRAACVAFGVAWAPFLADLRAHLASNCVLGVLEAAGVVLLAGNGAVWQVQGR